mgnify:CR=1 FL=1
MKRLLIIALLLLGGCASSEIAKPTTFREYYAYIAGIEVSVLNSANSAVQNGVMTAANRNTLVAECQKIDVDRKTALALYETGNPANQTAALTSIQGILQTANALTTELIKLEGK